MRYHFQSLIFERQENGDVRISDPPYRGATIIPKEKWQEIEAAMSADNMSLTAMEAAKELHNAEWRHEK